MFIYFTHIFAVSADVVYGAVPARCTFADHPVKLYLVAGIAYNGAWNGAHDRKVFEAGMASSVKSGTKAGVGPENIYGIFLIGAGNIKLVKGAARPIQMARYECRHCMYKWSVSAQRKPGSHTKHVRLTDTCIYKAVRVAFLKPEEK